MRSTLASSSGEPLPDDHHVLRYIGKKHVDNGVVNGSGFLRRPSEDASSVNWMECFPPPEINQILEVINRRRLKYEKRAQLVKLNVGHTKAYIFENSPGKTKLAFVHDPLPAEGAFLEDQSHALICGVPVLDTPEGEMIKDLLGECIIEKYPVVPDR
jgi:hypothetical protein